MKKHLNKKSWYTMLAAGDGSLDVYIYGTIGSWETNVDTFRAALAGYENTPLTVYISSFGGYFEDGLPIFNMLKQHQAEVITIVMGYAVSMASYLALAGNRRKAAKNSLFMIHRAQGFAFGDADQMRKEADISDKHDEAIISAYMDAMGLSRDEVFALLQAETWYTAEEALAAGLIDEIIDQVDQAKLDEVLPKANVRDALRNFKNAPVELLENQDNSTTQLLRNILKKLNAVVGDPPPQPPTPITIEEVEMTKEELDAALQAQHDKTMEAIRQMFKPPEPEKPDGTASSESLDALKKELSALNDKYAALETEMKSLKAEAPSTDVEENTGASDDTGDAW